MNIKNKAVLVTGASSGLGKEMAYQLATKHGAEVVLVARRESNLIALQSIINEAGGSKTHVVPADLSIEGDIERVLQYCKSLPNFTGAILNAGITHFGEHADLEWSYFEKMVQVNIMSVVRMTNSLFPYFNQLQGESRIMIVSSMASLFPVPYQSAYSGTKGFLTNFANALSQEVRHGRFKIAAYCPGGIKTEMTGGDDFSSLSQFLEPVEKVAATGIRGFLKGKMTFVPGLLNNFTCLLGRLLPRDFMTKQTAKIYRKALHSDKGK